jgi:hypothetical protein
MLWYFHKLKFSNSTSLERGREAEKENTSYSEEQGIPSLILRKMIQFLGS